MRLVKINASIATLVFLSVTAFSKDSSARLFGGPSKDDLKNIYISVSNSKCPLGQYSFEIKNLTKYKVLDVFFIVQGEIPGRSTKYNLGPVSSDIILTPFAKTELCATLDNSEWPPGAKLRIIPSIISATVEDNGERVNLIDN